MMKQCTKCKREWSEFVAEDLFSKKSGKLAARCKECVNKAKREKALAARVLTLQKYSESEIPYCHCTCGCYDTNIYVLQLDHPADGPISGVEHRKLMAKEMKGNRGDLIVRWAKKNDYPPKVLRVLCASCHASISGYGMCYREILAQRKIAIHSLGAQQSGS